MPLAPDTARYIRMTISSLSNGVIGAIGILLTAATGESGAIPQRAVVIAALTGVALMFKDVQAYLSAPPVEGVLAAKEPHV